MEQKRLIQYFYWLWQLQTYFYILLISFKLTKETKLVKNLEYGLNNLNRAKL